MKVIISKKVLKKIKKSDDFIKRHFVKAFERLKQGFPFERQWNVHKLKWKYGIYWSINVTWDYRLIFRFDGDVIYIDEFWIHSKLYWYL